jgi:hypothetical protein
MEIRSILIEDCHIHLSYSHTYNEQCNGSLISCDYFHREERINIMIWSALHRFITTNTNTSPNKCDCQRSICFKRLVLSCQRRKKNIINIIGFHIIEISFYYWIIANIFFCEYFIDKYEEKFFLACMISFCFYVNWTIKSNIDLTLLIGKEKSRK